MVESVRHDLRHAWLALSRAPVLTGTAILVLALATGATTAVFSVVHGVLLRPLPWADSERLMRVREYRDGDTRGWRMAGLTNDTFDAWQQSASTIDGLAAWSSSAFPLSGAGDAVRLPAASISPALLPMLGYVPAEGRMFRPEEARPGANHVAILSHAMWRDRFSGDAAIVGRAITLDGEPYTVIGVAPPGFYFPDREALLWVPLYVPPADRGRPEQRNVFFFSALARLKPGVTPQQAAAEATSAARSVGDETLGSALFGSGPPIVEVQPLLDTLTAGVRPALLVLFAAVGAVLLIACANLASLLLARGLARRRELAVRAALGASPRRLARQLLIESLLLSLGGTLVGVALAALLLRGLPAAAPADFPRLDDVAIDGRVLSFTILISIGAALLFGIGPALQGARPGLLSALSDGGAALGGGFRRLASNRARAALLVVEIALAMTLLAASGLLVRSFVALTSMDTGFDPANVLTARINFPRSNYDSEQIAITLDTILSRLRSTSRVEAAGSVNLLPLTPGETIVLFDNPFAGHARGPDRFIRARFRSVSPGFVEAMGVRVLRGRAFTWNDTRAAAPVVLVNQAFVTEHLEGREPLGTRLPGAFGPDPSQRDWEIVGVVSNVRQAGLDAEPSSEVWVSWTQLEARRGLAPGSASIVVRTTGDPLALATPLRTYLREVDPTLALADIRTMDRRVASSVAQPRLAATLLGSLALIAALLAATGLYGVLAYGVAQRRREIGLRTVLGATPRALVTLVAAQALLLTVAGLVIGTAASLAVTPLMASLLFGVPARDLSTLAAVAGVLLAVALAASIVPARRALRVNPAESLRSVT